MNLGKLSVEVWPPYIGMATAHPGPPGAVAPAGEPFADPDYTRGMIMWRHEPDPQSPNGQRVVGSAKIWLPKGVFTHVVFFFGPHSSHQVAGCNPLEQPIMFDRPGMINIDPIRNQQYLPRGGV